VSLTLIAGILIVALNFAAKYLASLIVSIIAAAALVYDYLNISSAVDMDDSEFVTASVGWGIQLATIASIVAVIASFLMLRQVRATRQQATGNGPKTEVAEQES
jgi:hypothetical protein